MQGKDRRLEQAVDVLITFGRRLTAVREYPLGSHAAVIACG